MVQYQRWRCSGSSFTDHGDAEQVVGREPREQVWLVFTVGARQLRVLDTSRLCQIES